MSSACTLCFNLYSDSPILWFQDSKPTLPRHSELAVAVTKVLTALITGTSALLANSEYCIGLNLLLGLV